MSLTVDDDGSLREQEKDGFCTCKKKKKILEQGDRYRITSYSKILNFENLTVNGVGFREKKRVPYREGNGHGRSEYEQQQKQQE